MQINRRSFLKLGLSGAVALSGYGLAKHMGSDAFIYEDLRPSIDDKSENFYRGMFNYDRIARTTCAGNCTQACGWKAYVKGDTLIRTEPAADYDVFDPVGGKAYLPRGCNRGASYPRYIYGPTRVKTPLIRVGPRGSGRFRRATWDEALDLIADNLIKIIREDGPETIALFSPIPSYSYISAASGYRLGSLMGATGPLSFYDWYCDLPAGEPETWGVQTEECEEWDWTNAKLIILWGANVAESRIPASHFVTEAKYNGTKVVSILTDYNASSKLADVAICPRPGTDSALALGLTREIISKGWHDEDYIKTFTDMPFLVRKDTGKFLRESDLVPNGDDFKFYIWCASSNKLILAPGTMGDTRDTLDWNQLGVSPDLNFSGRVKLASSEETEVETVWLRLNQMLNKDYTLHKVAEITGINQAVIADLASDIHKYSPTCIIEGGGANHWYHNDLNNRTMILLMAITGNIGYNGGGFHQYTGQYRVWLKGMPGYAGLAKSKAVNTTLFVWTHFDKELWKLNMALPDMVKAIETGKLTKLPDGSDVSVNPEYEMAYRQYLLIKSLSQSDMPVYPKPPAKPRAMLIWRGNFLNNAKGGYKLYPWFADDKKLQFVINIDFRISTTGLYSDVVLPAASWYEKFDIETTPMHPYFHCQGAVIKPVHQSKTDFEIMCLIAERIQERAVGLKNSGSWNGLWEDKTKDVIRDYTKLHDLFVDQAGELNPYFKGTGKGALDTAEKVAHYIIKNSPILFPEKDKYQANPQAFSPEIREIIERYFIDNDPDKYAAGFLELAKKAPVPFPAIQPERPHNPFRENIKRKLPWPAGGQHAKELTISKYPCVLPDKVGKTVTGRQQFYIDHSTYLTLNEALPVYKVPESDMVNGKPGPLKMNTPHGRWKTHSTYSDIDILLRLQRHEAVVMMNVNDANKRNIADGDLVEVFNDYGRYVCRAKILPGIGPSMVRIDHAWEKFQYREGYFNLITPVRPNPTQAVRYPEEDNAPDKHLKFAWNLWGVCGNECDTTVDVRKVR